MTLTNEQIFGTLVLPYLNHAVRMYEASYASSGDIDAAMQFGCGYPKGPLTVIDEFCAAECAGPACCPVRRDRRPPAPACRAPRQKLATEGRTFADEEAN